jgi:hypothetical protein
MQAPGGACSRCGNLVAGVRGCNPLGCAGTCQPRPHMGYAAPRNTTMLSPWLCRLLS